MSNKFNGLQHARLPVRLRNPRIGLRVPADIFMRPETTQPDSLWVLGFGAGPLAVRGVLSAQHQSGLNGAAVVFPYHLIPTHLLEAFTDEAVPQIVDALVPQGRVALGGESRGAGVAIRGGGQIPERLYAAGFLEPAFINSRAMGDDPQLAVRSLLRRLGLLNIRQLEEPLHAGARQAGLTAVLELGATVLGGRGLSALHGGLRTVVAPEVANVTIGRLDNIVAAGVPTRIAAGIYDPVFPPHELREALRPHGLDGVVYDVHAAHVNPGTPEGQAQVQALTDFVGSYAPVSPAGPL